jgi:hypothetical protein
VIWSDRRLKEDIALSDINSDLSTLRKIQITDYQRIAQGNREKKVIAQQVEEVFPQAVRQMRGVIPSIFAQADRIEFDISTGVATLHTAVSHGLTARDHIDLYTDKRKFTDVPVKPLSPTSFEVELTSRPEEVFIYGKYVDDLKSVDYDAIAMLNVSATQAQQVLIEELQSTVSQLAASVIQLQNQVGDSKCAATSHATAGMNK